jgi:hypothetical protein
MSDEQGWIKLHRCLKNSSTFRRLNAIQKLIAIYIILNANHQDGLWHDIYKGCEVEIKRGQLITSRHKIMSEWFNDDKLITDKKIRTTLERLKKCGFLSIETTSNYTKLTVVNYDKYQGRDLTYDQVNDSQMSKESPGLVTQLASNGPQTIIDNNEKNEKNKKECQEVFDYYGNVFSGLYSRLTLTVRRKNLICDRLEHGYSVDQIKKAINNIRTSSFHCGENDKGLFYASIEFLCKDDEHLENWINHRITKGSSSGPNKAYELYLKAKEEEEREKKEVII